jgi:hypothetical protein
MALWFASPMDTPGVDVTSRTSNGFSDASPEWDLTSVTNFKLTSHQRREAASRKANGEPVRESARSYNVNAATISRI